ncbi:MAG TPA: hypothetical protein DEF51_31660, partial [Myxococcales bacterium]|nr:hypothetical protein [Myxococcales bacterium]
MTWSVALAVTMAAAPALAQPAAPPTTALVGGTLMPGDGPSIENATVVIRDGRVLSVSAGGAVPAGAEEIDCRGAVITPGFVGTQVPMGLVEIELEPSTVDQAPEEEDADPIRASFSVVAGSNPMSTLIPIARRWGVTSVVSTPMGGLVS